MPDRPLGAGELGPARPRRAGCESAVDDELLTGDPLCVVAREEQGHVGDVERLAHPAERGYLHCGPSGAGHFVKMVHNAIEYGLMASYAEGFNVMEHAPYDLDMAQIAELWRRGSVVGSWLLDLTAAALAADPSLDGLRTGFITTRKTGKAHDRNLLRRRFRAMVLVHAPRFAEAKRYLVTIARPGAAAATFAELEADWLRQARRLGLFDSAPPKP